MTKIHPVILSGGSGTRLWPVSRKLLPKQYVELIAGETLFQRTVTRICQSTYEPPTIVCGESHKFLVKDQLGDRAARAIYIEPTGRNTAPAIAIACHQLPPDDVLLVMPSDHVIADDAAFDRAVAHAVQLTADGHLVTFGIQPTSPHTGYGYIEHSGDDVVTFTEKPDRARALEFIASGRYFWNSGIFAFRVRDILAALQQHCPQIVALVEEAIARGHEQEDCLHLDHDTFAQCENISIDFAVMEKMDNIKVVPASMGWSDLGSFDELYQFLPKDADHNHCVGDVVATGSRGNYIRADAGLVAAIGVSDLIIVASGDVLLVAHRDQSGAIKQLVNQLDAQGRSEHLNHLRVLRPWGSYRDIDNSNRDRVKRIVVDPGKSLSLQSHRHRAEHWVVVRGSATVINGDRELHLTEDQSTYIPAGQKHRLINKGEIPLEVIEVQTGSYLGEDDIVRYEDDWGRT